MPASTCSSESTVGEAGHAREREAIGLGLSESREATVFRLQDVGRGAAVQRSRPPVPRLDEQQLVLQPGEGQLAVVVDTERILIEGADLLAEAFVVVGLEPEAALVGRLRADHERARRCHGHTARAARACRSPTSAPARQEPPAHRLPAGRRAGRGWRLQAGHGAARSRRRAACSAARSRAPARCSEAAGAGHCAAGARRRRRGCRRARPAADQPSPSASDTDTVTSAPSLRRSRSTRSTMMPVNPVSSFARYARGVAVRSASCCCVSPRSTRMSAIARPKSALEWILHVLRPDMLI